jgi:hypothetical protein
MSLSEDKCPYGNFINKVNPNLSELKRKECLMKQETLRTVSER